MRFDDRLRTVLAQPASDPHDRAVRWRQLVELVARAGGEADRALVEQALARIRDDSERVDERVRTAAAVAIASLALPPELVAIFAADRISVAAPILVSAKLTASEWKSVSAAACDDCREFIASMRSEPGAAMPSSPAAEQRLEPETIPSISEVVARVERLRRAREEAAAPAAAAGGLEESPRLFRWECNESGEIEWVEGAPRGALVGQSIAQSGLDEGGVDRSVERAFAARAPFHEGVLQLTRGGAVGGSWKISGVPAFEPASGRFAGYRGVAERSKYPRSERGGSPAESPESLRELAHEIRTPLNAIIGFAEIISGEYLGPAEGSYRERANEIVAQARLLLTAVEDLDLAAKLRSSNGESKTELSDALARAWEEIDRQAQLRGVRIRVAGGEEPAWSAIEPLLAQRLIERLALAVVGHADEGELLTFRIGSDAEFSTLAVNRPSGLKEADLAPDRNRRSGDAATLPLRLVMGLARTAGGNLDAQLDELRLRIPKA